MKKIQDISLPHSTAVAEHCDSRRQRALADYSASHIEYNGVRLYSELQAKTAIVAAKCIKEHMMIQYVCSV